MTGIVRHFLSAIFTVDFKVLSLRDDLRTCKTKCKEENGHLPYLYQGLDRPMGYRYTIPPLYMNFWDRHRARLPIGLKAYII